MKYGEIVNQPNRTQDIIITYELTCIKSRAQLSDYEFLFLFFIYSIHDK